MARKPVQFNWRRHWKRRVEPLLSEPIVQGALAVGMKLIDPAWIPGDSPYLLGREVSRRRAVRGKLSWYQPAGRCHWIVFFSYVIGRKSRPDLRWEIVTGDLHTVAVGSDVGGARALVMDILLFDQMSACGMSNGGMMCYRLAAELSDRIAAVAPVAGTIAIEECKPKRPVPVIHFHGSKDGIVLFEAAKGKAAPFMKLKGVEDSIQTWVKLNGCDEKPKAEMISKDGDEMKVTRTTYGGGKAGSEVVLVVVEGGGHTWPGREPPVGFIGKSARNVSANDLMWEFFQKHKLK